MKYFVVAIFALVTPIFARPQAPAAPAAPAVHALAAHPQAPGGSTTPATIINQAENVGPDGSFNYSYETSNGIKVEQGGFTKQEPQAKSVDPNNPDAGGDVQVIQGAFSYTAPDGQEISLKYVADDKGFQPEGAHLPTPPPVPEGIARSLEPQAEQQHPLALAAAAIQHPVETHPPIASTAAVTGTTLNPSPVTQA